MTIKKSLILSHIAVCVLPFLMTLFILAAAFGGLFLYAESGNHVMAESSFQFNIISNAVKGMIFHTLRHHRELDQAAWVMELTDPVETYILVEKKGKVFYEYGNDVLEIEVEALKNSGVTGRLTGNHNDSYSLTDGDRYQFVERKFVRQEPYDVYVIAHKPWHRNDGAIERAFHFTTRFIEIVLLILIVVVSWLLSRFIMGRILRPLKELEKGAGEIRKGNLDISISYDHHDEFMPAIDAFNLMAGKLKKSLAEEAENEENRKQLIASMAHDIRTPITAIRAYVEGLIDHVASTPEMQDRYLHVIARKTEVLNRMVEQLFLLSKLDLGEKALPLETVDLSESAKRFVADNELGWKKRGALVTVEAQENIKVKMNPLLLERVGENLISNSIRYKTKDLVHVQVRVKKEGNKALLLVTDDGPGVTEESLKKLTEAFYRTDKARSKTDQGSGLGLAIVKRAMDLMNGNVEFRNAAPHGLEVRLDLPLEEP